MENRSVFISSCSRRDMTRRRPGRLVPRAQMIVAIIALAAALGGMIAARGGI